MDETTDQTLEAWRTFLESAPAGVESPIGRPQVRKEGFQGNVWWELPCPRIQLHCGVDGGTRWFQCTRSEISGLQAGQNYEYIDYTCRDCGGSPKTYSVVVVLPAEGPGQEDARATKFGELPALSVPIAASAERLLDADSLELFRQGVRAEIAGLGLAAAIYARRLIENQWKSLVSRMREAADGLGVGDLSPFDAALEASHFADAARALEQAVPPRLLILDGRNPLTLLDRAMSIDLRRLSDRECLQQAADIRTVLGALIESISDALKDQAALKDAAARLQRVEP